MHRVITIALLLTFAIAPPWTFAEDPETDNQRQLRNEHLQETFERLQLTYADAPERPLAHIDKPLLAYTNPVRSSFVDGGGGTYIWLEGKRPVAAAMLSVRGKEQTWLEMSSLSAKPLSCQFGEKMIWSPEKGNVAATDLAKCPKPAPSDRLRLVQFRTVAKRFSVVQHDTQADEDNELRLLSQPVYRWQDTENGVIDAAVFALCETTDPETLLVLEIIQPEGVAAPHWKYSMARTTSRPLKFYLDGELISELGGYWSGPRTPKDPYLERKLIDGQ